MPSASRRSFLLPLSQECLYMDWNYYHLSYRVACYAFPYFPTSILDTLQGPSILTLLDTSSIFIFRFWFTEKIREINCRYAHKSCNFCSIFSIDRAIYLKSVFCVGFTGFMNEFIFAYTYLLLGSYILVRLADLSGLFRPLRLPHL